MEVIDEEVAVGSRVRKGEGRFADQVEARDVEQLLKRDLRFSA